MVDLALSTIALAVYSRAQRHPPAATEASSTYHKLLRLSQSRFARMGSKPDAQAMDACLLAIFLMGRYEGIIHRPGGGRGGEGKKKSLSSLPIWCHHNGAMAMLKMWHHNGRPYAATFIMRETRKGLIRSSLLRNLPVPSWMRDGAGFGERDLALGYDRIFVRTVDLHYASMSLARQKKNNQYNPLLFEKLNNELHALSTALQDWVSKFPATWSYRPHTLNDNIIDNALYQKYFYSRTVYSYPNPGYTAVWNQYFAMGMLVSSIRLRMLNQPVTTTSIHNDEQQREEAHTAQLQTMANNLASSLPFCLERFKVDNNNHLELLPTHKTRTIIDTNTNGNDTIKPHLAVLAVWPLTIASSIKEGLDPQQQLWFRSQLATLGRATGEGVLESVETDEWPIL
ncbi:MAG: hypothetical protein Q9200_003725 [Gallowayella weberi]